MAQHKNRAQKSNAPHQSRTSHQPRASHQSRAGQHHASRGDVRKAPAHRSSSAQQNSSRATQHKSTSAGIIEGRRACAEALETGVPIKRALIAASPTAQDLTLARLVARLNDAQVPVQNVPKARLDALSSHGAHQGIVLETQPFAYAELEEILSRVSASDEQNALLVVLDHVTDEGNFGAIVRSCEVVGAAGVIIPKARTATVGTAAYKTSAGAVLHVPIAQVPNLPAALDRIKEAGFWVGAASEHAEQDVWHAPMEGKLCLVMGSEGSGISRLVQQKCDFGCRLPQKGRVESLNVAQAATVLCYEWLRRTMTAGEN